MAPIKSWQLEAADSESHGSRLASHADTIIYASVERRWKTQRQRRKDKHTKTKKLSLRERSPDHKNSGETQSIKDVDPEMKRG